MKSATNWYTGVGIIAGFGAAILWFCASLVRVPPFPDVGFNSSSSVFRPVHAALVKASRLNASAAACATIGALCAAASALLM